MQPADRPVLDLDPAADGHLATFGVADAAPFAVITGTAVSRGGGRVPAELTITKVFDTKLWKDADGNNPLGQAPVRERIETSMVTGPDGSFEWAVNPSTRPIEFAAGNKESYLLTVTGPRGEGISRRLVVERGKTYDLGTIVVA